MEPGEAYLARTGTKMALQASRRIEVIVEKEGMPLFADVFIWSTLPREQKVAERVASRAYLRI